MRSILVLTEDRSDTAPSVVQGFVSHAATARRQPRVPRAAFALDSTALRRAMRGNIWKSASPRDRGMRIALVRAIANKLAESTRAFVVIHFDGDRAWRERDSEGATERAFERLRTEIAQQLVAAWDLARRDGRPRSERPEDALARLVTAIPYYSIEAWLYQSTDEAVRLCREHYQGRDVERFERWRTARHELDEVVKLVESLCLGRRHNAELLSGFPAIEVDEAGTSFHAFCDAAQASGLVNRDPEDTSPRGDGV